jgi:hypothetical protein
LVRFALRAFQIAVALGGGSLFITMMQKSPFWRNHQAERSVSAPREARPLNVSLGISSGAVIP